MNGKRKLTVLLLTFCLLTPRPLPWQARRPHNLVSRAGPTGTTADTLPQRDSPVTPAPTEAPTPEPTATPTPTEVPTPSPPQRLRPEAPRAAHRDAWPTEVPTPEPTATPRPGPPRRHAQSPPRRRPETEVPPFTDEDYTTGSITAQEENAFLLLNQDRAANGRSALELDPALCDLARLKSRDMFLNNYFSHTSPTYGSAAQMLSAYGYAFTSVGENIAHHATVEKAQAAFMSSSGHRQNILGSQWTKVGIGVWEDSQGFVYVTQLFVR